MDQRTDIQTFMPSYQLSFPGIKLFLQLKCHSVFVGLMFAMNVLFCNFDENIISEKQYDADVDRLTSEYLTETNKITENAVNLKNNIKGIKETSVKASQELQQSFDEGIAEGTITKDKDGKRAFKVYSRSYGIYKFVSELHNYIIILFLDALMTSESLLPGVAGLSHKQLHH